MENLFVIFLILFVVACLGVGLFSWQYRKEKRSLWLGVSFIVALFSCLFLVIFLLLQIVEIEAVRILLITGAVLFVFVSILFSFVLIFSLFGSGIRLLRREGKSLAYALTRPGNRLCAISNRMADC